MFVTQGEGLPEKYSDEKEDELNKGGLD